MYGNRALSLYTACSGSNLSSLKKKWVWKGIRPLCPSKPWLWAAICLTFWQGSPIWQLTAKVLKGIALGRVPYFRNDIYDDTCFGAKISGYSDKPWSFTCMHIAHVIRWLWPLWPCPLAYDCVAVSELDWISEYAMRHYSIMEYLRVCRDAHQMFSVAPSFAQN